MSWKTRSMIWAANPEFYDCDQEWEHEEYSAEPGLTDAPGSSAEPIDAALDGSSDTEEDLVAERGAGHRHPRSWSRYWTRTVRNRSPYPDRVKQALEGTGRKAQARPSVDLGSIAMVAQLMFRI